MKQLANKAIVSTLRGAQRLRSLRSAGAMCFAAAMLALVLLSNSTASASDFTWQFTTGDFTRPIISAVSPASGSTLNATSQIVTFNTNENADCKWSLADEAYGAMAGDCTGDGTTLQSCSASGLVEGANTLYLACRDTAGNADTVASNTQVAYTVDTTPPIISAVNPASGTTLNATSQIVTFNTNENADCKWSLVDQAYGAMADDCTGDGTTLQSCSASGLVEGANTLYLACRDTAGNADTVASNTQIAYTVDTTPPIISAVNPASGTTLTATSQIVTFNTNENADCKWSLVDQAYGAMADDCTGDGTTLQSCSASGFAQGANTVFLACRDTIGNADTAASNTEVAYTVDSIPPTVAALHPTDGLTGVCVNKKLTATFSEVMTLATVAPSFTVGGVTGSVAYDPATRIVTFTPDSDLSTLTAYTATISTSAKDLAGNSLAANYVWTFTTGITTCAAAVALGAAETLGGFGGGAGMTNTGISTSISGDIGSTSASTLVSGFHDSAGDIYTETGANIGAVSGRIYTDAPAPGGAGLGGNGATFATATAVANAASAAWNNMSPGSLPGGVDPGAGQLGGLTLVPGIYKADSSTFLVTGADLTLDGQGDPDSVWVFQSATTLTIGAAGLPRTINLTNSANARNVFWYVGTAARIEDGCSVAGTIIANTGVTISTAGQTILTTLEGRALALSASVTMVNTVITLPAP